MDLNLSGKVAIVAGGSKGFGAATAHRLAQEGARLLIASRGEDNLKSIVKELRDDHGTKAEYCVCDLTRAGDAEKAARAALEHFGRIDVLVSSVGAAGGGLFWEIPDEVWESAFALKFMGNIRMMRAVIPAMREQGYGRIVAIVGQFGKQPHPRFTPSGAANAALLSVIKGVADEVAPDGLIVNAINPGASRTKRWNDLIAKVAKDTGTSVEKIEAEHTQHIPLGRFGEPDEIARHVCFLASDAAGYMTGTSVTVDGGYIKLPA